MYGEDCKLILIRNPLIFGLSARPRKPPDIEVLDRDRPWCIIFPKPLKVVI